MRINEESLKNGDIITFENCSENTLCQIFLNIKKKCFSKYSSIAIYCDGSIYRAKKEKIGKCQKGIVLKTLSIFRRKKLIINKESFCKTIQDIRKDEKKVKIRRYAIQKEIDSHQLRIYLTSRTSEPYKKTKESPNKKTFAHKFIGEGFIQTNIMGYNYSGNMFAKPPKKLTTEELLESLKECSVINLCEIVYNNTVG